MSGSEEKSADMSFCQDADSLLLPSERAMIGTISTTTSVAVPEQVDGG